MKVIFLDIDGVLNICHGKRDKFGQLFHPELEQNLKTIIDATGAKIVISSTWRLSGVSVMRDMWKHRSLAGEIIGITPTSTALGREDRIRGYEIQAWIDNNKPERYVIIDDDSDMLSHQMPFFVKCSQRNEPDAIDIGYGLTKAAAQEAINILNYGKI